METNNASMCYDYPGAIFCTNSSHNYPKNDVTITLYAGGDVFRFIDLPTNDTGLTLGQVWRDGNTLKIKI